MEVVEGEARNLSDCFASRETDQTWNAMDDALARFRAAIVAQSAAHLRPDAIIATVKRIQLHVVQAVRPNNSQHQHIFRRF